LVATSKTDTVPPRPFEMKTRLPSALAMTPMGLEPSGILIVVIAFLAAASTTQPSVAA